MASAPGSAAAGRLYLNESDQRRDDNRADYGEKLSLIPIRKD